MAAQGDRQQSQVYLARFNLQLEHHIEEVSMFSRCFG